MIDELLQQGASVGRAKSGKVLRIDLRGTDIGWNAELLQYVLSCPALRELYLADRSVSDEDAKRFGELSKLKVVDLENTLITDVGLMALTGPDHRSLELINVRGTATTPETIAALRKKLIGTRIIGP